MVSQGSTTRLRIEFAQASDPGRDPNKQVNEDSCGYAETKFGHLCVLCDGMGGHHGGKEASRTAITTIFQVIEQTPPHVLPAQALKAAVEEAARRVYRLGGPPENRTRPGSTVVAMLLHDKGVDVAHVGDSRAYVIRGNQIYPLTRDHSMVQGMIDAGMLTEAQAIGHPDANKITRALGMKPEVEVEVRPEPMELFNGDVLLQSSDGLTDLALSADILGCARQGMNSGDLNHACNTLVQMANDRGGHDNITVQMARVVDAGPKTGTTIPQAGPTNFGGAATPPPQGQLVSAGQAMGQPARPLETLPNTVPDGSPGHHPQAGPGGGPGGMQWAPVPPTAAGASHSGAGMAMAHAGAAAAGGVSPTVPGGPQSSPTWSSGQYQGPGAHGAVPESLAPYRLDAQLPLPPQSPFAPAGHTAPPGGYAGAGMAPMPPSLSYPDGNPARGGIVFVIIGLSMFVAVMIILVIWALFLRA